MFLYILYITTVYELALEVPSFIRIAIDIS